MTDTNDPPPRLAPGEPLPPYSYVTGRFPHPTSDPAGHGFGKPAPKAPSIDPQNWQASQAYLCGCDLFNHGYYWEAHEIWEGLWNASGRRGTVADFIKGLIKLAAAGVKAREGRRDGVARHGKRAAELIGRVRDSTGRNFLGLDLEQLIAVACDLPASLIANPRDDLPAVVVFDFRLLPTTQG